MLERHFSNALQKTPAEVGITVRLNLACHLLTNTDYTVTHIAAATGFCDASHLNKVFRTREGDPPEIWRQKNRANLARDLMN